jgi:anti-anti-sigma regulatory factor
VTNRWKSSRIAARAERADPVATTLVLIVGGELSRADIRQLCDRARASMDGTGADLVVCDVGAAEDANAVTVDALARLQLIARRSGRRICIANASPALRDLMELMGLTDALPLSTELSLQPQGEAEAREHGCGVQEEIEPHDPIA